MRIEPIDHSAVQQVVEAHGFDWVYRDQTESTNVDVLQYYDQHQREVVAFSEAQSAGRGRRGRQWVSPYARNIYCSVGIAKNMPASKQGLLSIVTGLALCHALEQCAAISFNLKWPNDVLFEGRKLGGILIESRPLEGERHLFAIGFGLNVFMDAEALAEIPQPVTSLHQISPASIDRTRVLIATIDAVIQSIRVFHPEDVIDLIREFQRFDAYHDQPVEVLSASKRITGINRGITDTGQLQLETESGIEIHSAAEISLQAAK